MSQKRLAQYDWSAKTIEREPLNITPKRSETNDGSGPRRLGNKRLEISFQDVSTGLRNEMESDGECEFSWMTAIVEQRERLERDCHFGTAKGRVESTKAYRNKRDKRMAVVGCFGWSSCPSLSVL